MSFDAIGRHYMITRQMSATFEFAFNNTNKQNHSKMKENKWEKKKINLWTGKKSTSIKESNEFRVNVKPWCVLIEHFFTINI